MSVRRVLGLLCLLIVAAASATAVITERRAPDTGHSAPGPTPIVIELFTSEGCSSCPPADELLSKFAKEPAIAGVPVIPLGMHVTYWDQLGWRDPASLQVATERQQAYGRVFGPDSLYTPQAVIDGRTQVIGSAEAGISRAVADAARQPHAQMTVKASVDGSTLTADVSLAEVPAALRDPLETVLVLTQDGLTSVVTRGENGGHTLHNDAVVRLVFGGDAAGAAMHSYRANLRPEWQRERLHVIAMLQGKTSRSIYGAATTAPEIRH